MDWRKKICGVHPLEVSGPVVESDPPRSDFDCRKKIFGVLPLEVDSDLDTSSEDSFILQFFPCTEGSPESSSPTSGRHVNPLVLHPTVMPPSPPRPGPGHRVTEVAEAVPSHRLDSTGPEPESQPESAAQRVADLGLDVEDDGRRQDCGGEEVLEPASSMQSQEPPVPDLTTTLFPEPPHQEDTGLHPPSTNTQGSPVKRLTTAINTIFPPLCFRWRRRVQPESEPVPAAQRGRLQRFLAFFRRMVWKT